MISYKELKKKKELTQYEQSYKSAVDTLGFSKWFSEFYKPFDDTNLLNVINWLDDNTTRFFGNIYIYQHSKRLQYGCTFDGFKLIITYYGESKEWELDIFSFEYKEFNKYSTDPTEWISILNELQSDLNQLKYDKLIRKINSDLVTLCKTNVQYNDNKFKKLFDFCIEYGYSKFNSFVGFNKEVRLCTYNYNNNTAQYLEFTIETDDTISFVYEIDDKEMFYIDKIETDALLVLLRERELKFDTK